MKPRKALHKIQEILDMDWNAYGEDIHPSEQLNFIRLVLAKVDPPQPKDE